VLTTRRHELEKALAAEPLNYDLWFDYCTLEEQASVDVARSREIFDRAVLNVPPVQEKRFWKRYIYLWLNFAIFEELTAAAPERAAEVYQRALNLVPHAEFTFAKLWIQYAQFLVRQKELVKAR